METSPGYILVGSFINPISPKKAVLFDGAIAVGLRTQTIRECGYLASVRRKYPTWQVVSIDEGIILPAFADAHTKLFCYPLRNSKKEKRATWQNKNFAKVNKNFANLTYATETCCEFFADLQKNGTLTAFINLSLNINEIAILSKLPEPLCRVKFYAGPTVANQNLPKELLKDKTQLLDALREISNSYKKYFAITPLQLSNIDNNLLYAISSFGLDGVFVQMNLGTFPEEFQLAAKLHPASNCLTEILDSTGLLGSNTILAGCNYLVEKDWRAISAMNSLVAHTPLADESLRTDRMPLEKMREYQINWALASDVGASPSISMLAEMQSFLRTHTKSSDVTAVEALYRATRALPEFIGLKTQGTIEAGAPANFAIIKSPKATRTLEPEKCLRILIEGSIQELEKRVLATISKGKVVFGEIPNFIP